MWFRLLVRSLESDGSNSLSMLPDKSFFTATVFTFRPLPFDASDETSSSSSASTTRFTTADCGFLLTARVSDGDPVGASGCPVGDCGSEDASWSASGMGGEDAPAAMLSPASLGCFTQLSFP